MRRGVREYLLKPLDEDELEALIRKVVAELDAETSVHRHAAAARNDDLTLYDGDTRPRGSSDEGFVHTNWGRVTKGPGLWNDAYETTRWLVAWPCAFRLEVLRGGFTY